MTCEPNQIHEPALSRIAVAEALELTQKVFERHGAPAHYGSLVAQVLIDADRCGIHSHGLARVPMYVDAIRAGRIDVVAVPSAEHETPAASVWNARRSFGHVSAATLVDHACVRAREVGAHIAVCHSSTHFGHAGYWAARAASRGMLGIALTTGNPLVVPTGGSRPELGTNPLAIALEGQSDRFLLDMSTSVVSLGKLELAQLASVSIPEGWAVDAHGDPVVASGSFLESVLGGEAGGLLPLGGGSTALGGHKGYGLAAAVEILCAVLSGGSDVTPGRSVDPLVGSSVAHCVLVVDPGQLAGLEVTKRALDSMLEALRASPSADSETPVQVPGDPERDSLAASGDHVLVDPAAWRVVQSLAGIQA